MKNRFISCVQSRGQIFSFLLAMLACSQHYSVAQSSTNDAMIQALANKGILIQPDQCASLNAEDFSLISSFDFNAFRNEKTIRQVQIKKGPQIALQPLQWMIEHQYSIDQEILNKKQGEVLPSSTISTITLIDVGAGFKAMDKSEKWKTE